MGSLHRCPSCGFANAPSFPVCSYCLRRQRHRSRLARHEPRSHEVHGPSVTPEARTGPAAAEAWARVRAESPRVEGDQPTPTAPTPRGTFRTIAGLGTAAQLLSAAAGAAAALTGLSHAAVAIDLTVQRPSVGATSSVTEAGTRLADAATVATVVALALTAVVLVGWAGRAIANLAPLGMAQPTPASPARQAPVRVGAAAVAGAGLAVPKAVADVLWDAAGSIPHPGAPGGTPQAHRHRREPVRTAVRHWWLVWCTAPAVVGLVVIARHQPTSVEDLRAWSVVGVLAAGILWGATAASRSVCAIVGLAQHRRAALLAEDHPAAVRTAPGAGRWVDASVHATPDVVVDDRQPPPERPAPLLLDIDLEGGRPIEPGGADTAGPGQPAGAQGPSSARARVGARRPWRSADRQSADPTAGERLNDDELRDAVSW